VTPTSSAEHRFNYYEYDGSGLLVKSVTDANNGSGDSTLNGAATDFSISLPTPPDGWHIKTVYSYDGQARLVGSTLPSGRQTVNYYTKLWDNRPVVLSIPRSQTVGATTTYYGPVGYTVQNLAGRTAAQGIIAITSAGDSTDLVDWINDSTSSNYKTAVLVGSLGSLSTYTYDESASKLLSAKVYVNIPSTMDGTSGTDYDETTYAYDEVGHVKTVTDPTPTISKTIYDPVGPRG